MLLLHLRMTIAWMFISLCCIQQQAIAADTQVPQPTSSWFSASFDALDTIPSFSLIAPSGFTPTQDFISWGIGGISHVPNTTNNAKGAASIGLGLALPRNIGITFHIDATGRELSTQQELSFSLGKYFSGLDMSISAGARSITLWRDDGTKNTPSVYVAATKVLLFNDNLAIVNAGIGNNDFRIITDTAASTSRVKVASPFLSLAYYPLPSLSLMADYTSGITSLGVGMVPLASLPLSLSIGVYDIAKTIPGHKTLSIIASVSGSYTF